MKVHRETLHLSTAGQLDIVDVTADVEKAVINSEISEGFAVIFSPHTTVGVYIQEREGGLLADLKVVLDRLVPEDAYYRHNDWDIRVENMQPGELPNAHSHLRQVIGSKVSECVPVCEGRLMLGTWQRIMIVEWDCSRERDILIQICGE